MKRIIYFLSLSIVLSLCIEGNAQRIVAFDKKGKVKRVKYYEGELIKLKLLSKEVLVGSITQVTDTNFRIELREVELDSVKIVYNTQKLFGFKLLGKVLITAGTLYLSVDSFNRLINNEGPIVSESTIKAGSLLIGGGVISTLIARRPYRISKKRPLKIIDLTL